MPLSANTLIHFTSKKEHLKKILEENFRIFYCKEHIILGGKLRRIHVPMVSFCDIPLSEVKDHISKYGNYGIGLTKEWAVEHGLNPVLYVSKTSSLSASYRHIHNHYNTQSDTDIDDWTKEQKAIADILRYMKNYEADLTRQGKTIKNYRFSDEREWRYVPSLEEACDMYVSATYYTDNHTTVDAGVENLRLNFGPNDIKYIIINDDSEIGEFIDHLRRARGKHYSLDDIERLTTRILTSEQIKTDI